MRGPHNIWRLIRTGATLERAGAMNVVLDAFDASPPLRFVARAFQRRAGADQPPDVVRTAHQSFQPECNAAIPMVRLRYLACPKPAARTIDKKVS